jgi:type II secretory pathway pseudopilin PulG
MKTRTLIQAAVIAAAAAVPALSFAQQQAPVTRAQVRNELIQLEQAGYNPSAGEDVNYPDDIQAAEARIHQGNAVAQTQGAADTGYGPATSGTSQSGAAVAPQVGGPNPVDYGH